MFFFESPAFGLPCPICAGAGPTASFADRTRAFKRRAANCAREFASDLVALRPPSRERRPGRKSLRVATDFSAAIFWTAPNPRPIRAPIAARVNTTLSGWCISLNFVGQSFPDAEVLLP
jgi:hypothetical protein